MFRRFVLLNCVALFITTLVVGMTLWPAPKPAHAMEAWIDTDGQTGAPEVCFCCKLPSGKYLTVCNDISSPPR